MSADEKMEKIKSYFDGLFSEWFSDKLNGLPISGFGGAYAGNDVYGNTKFALCRHVWSESVNSLLSKLSQLSSVDQKSEELNSWYIQYVPDHCDRVSFENSVLTIELLPVLDSNDLFEAWAKGRFNREIDMIPGIFVGESYVSSTYEVCSEVWKAAAKEVMSAHVLSELNVKNNAALSANYIQAVPDGFSGIVHRDVYYRLKQAENTNELNESQECHDFEDDRIKPLVDALNEINNWLVCAPISTPEDMAQSFAYMQQVAQRALDTLTVTTKNTKEDAEEDAPTITRRFNR